jgi:hypothetical protein
MPNIEQSLINKDLINIRIVPIKSLNNKAFVAWCHVNIPQLNLQFQVGLFKSDTGFSVRWPDMLNKVGKKSNSLVPVSPEGRAQWAILLRDEYKKSVNSLDKDELTNPPPQKPKEDSVDNWM